MFDFYFTALKIYFLQLYETTIYWNLNIPWKIMIKKERDQGKHTASIALDTLRMRKSCYIQK